MQYATVGTEFIATVGMMVGGGVLLDGWLRTMPAFTLIGTAVGFAAALYRLVKLGKRLQNRQQSDDDDS